MGELIRFLVFVVGLFGVASTLTSAITSFVLPRSARNLITSLVFRVMRLLFVPWTRKGRPYRERDRAMALYAPFGLIALLVTWLILILLSYMLMFWGLGVQGWQQAFTVSGSSLLTLGFAAVTELPQVILALSEATIGLILVALLIAYLPTMYTSFSRRELAVTMLEVRAGAPPSAVEMLVRIHKIGRMDILDEMWLNWELWFVDIEESHTSLPALAFFRSPQPQRSWVNSAEAVLDAAALYSSALNVERSPRAQLCIRAGFLSLRQISNFFRIPYRTDPQYPRDPISLSQSDFEMAYDIFAKAGLPVKADREQAWQDFAGWRVNYDTVIVALSKLTMAPEGPWIPQELAEHGIVLPGRISV